MSLSMTTPLSSFLSATHGGCGLFSSMTTSLGKATMSCSSQLQLSAALIWLIVPPSHRITEPRLLSVAFINGPTDADSISLAILYTNHENRPHLTSKDLNITTSELLPSASAYIPTTLLPSAMSPEFGISPSLAPLESSTGKTSGVLIIGNSQIHLFGVRRRSKKDLKRASDEMDEDADQGSTDSSSKKKRAKRRRAKSVVDWPWGEISA